jgi:hypothetical protein
MKILFFLFTLLTVTSVSASSKYQLLSKSFYITDKLTLIPFSNDYSENYTPKFFPNDYKIMFQTESAYLDFVKDSIILKTVKRGTCFEFVLYQGKVVVEKRYRRKEHCIKNKEVEELTCSYLEDKIKLGSSKYNIIFIPENGFFLNCEVNLSYEGKSINLYRDSKNLVPNLRENSRYRNKWFILSNGALVTVQKLQFEELYFSEMDGVYFETKDAEEKFLSSAKIKFKQTTAWPDEPICYSEVEYLRFKNRELVDSQFCKKY